MTTTSIRVGRARLPLHSLNTLVIGSGAAALNAALSLRAQGQADIALATDAWGGGTSFNTGSDKQTYYKLGLAAGSPDSARDMAADLWAGGCMHGDIALCEALGSVGAFFNLVRLGVPFPQDRYGAYVGYKTDHDPRRRATSAGPLTSRLMAEALAAEVRRRRIRVLDGHDIAALLTAPDGDGRKVVGAVAVDRARAARGGIGFVVFNAVNIVLGTGGPAGLYEHSVYPLSQTGAHALAFEAGAAGQNLTESQFGLASIKFRWNLSGTYQQAVPRYVSTDEAGGDEREFLNEHFPDMGTLATAIFLKGYQWPFDPRKITGHGSSLIDLLVHRETVVLGRRVFLDFRRSPGGDGRLKPFAPGLLSAEARSYLERSGAVQPTPLERLAHMNPQAVEVYRRQGIDLDREPLEIAVCAQHNNGGLIGNIWWESNLRHLFPVGEVCGTHGVYRPGGSALNSGQVGSFRAAQFISRRYKDKPPAAASFLAKAGPQIEARLKQAEAMLGRRGRGRVTIEEAGREFRRRMSSFGGIIRDGRTIGREADAAWRQWESLKTSLAAETPAGLGGAFRALGLALTQALYLEAIRETIARGGRSRGSYLVLHPSGVAPAPTLGGEWRFAPATAEDFPSRNILEISLDERGRPVKRWTAVRPIPEEDDWFETVWAAFREDRIIR